MRNPLLRPFDFVRNTARVIKARNAAVDEIELLEDAAQHPELYRDPSWWARLVAATRRLLDVIPMPTEGRARMNNILLKAGVVAGGLSTLALTFHDTLVTDPNAAAVLNLLPPKYSLMVLGGLAFAGKLSAYLLPAPSQKPRQ